MKFLKLLTSALLFIGASTITVSARTVEAVDTLSAADALLRMPASTLDLLSTANRMDMIAYMEKDSLYNVRNALDGLSHLVRPMTPNYLQVQVTPVTRFTIRILPGSKGQVIGTAYTIGDSLQAADTQLHFFDSGLNEIKISKIIELASSRDFLDFKDVDRKTRDELLFLIPYPTVEYKFSPDGTELKARLTVGEFLGKETLDRLSPYLRRDLTYHWDGKKYRLERTH